jgi:exodeoxyribonuclease VII small subunit
MSAKKKAASPPDFPDFEQTLGELEQIVAAMEEEDLPLEELVTRFEKGTKLLGHCQEVLDSAKKRLRTIAAESGEARENPLNAEGSEPTEPLETDDDIRLF